MKETQETLVVLREELSLTQADHMRIVQQIAQSKVLRCAHWDCVPPGIAAPRALRLLATPSWLWTQGAIKLSDPPRPPALRDPSPDYSARSESHDTSTPKSRPPKARGGTSKPAQSKPRLAPKAKAPPRPKDADAPAPSAAVATPARSNKRSAIKDRQTFMMVSAIASLLLCEASLPSQPAFAQASVLAVTVNVPRIGSSASLPGHCCAPPQGSSRMDSMNLTAEVTLIGRMIKKKRQMRDKSFEDGYIYDFDLNKHEHLGELPGCAWRVGWRA